MSWRRALPWIDSAAGFFAGAIVIVLRDAIAPFYGLPLGVVTFIGIANVAYASIGSSLAWRRGRGHDVRGHLRALVGANVLWTIACGVLVLRYGSSATPFGLAHVIGEALFVLGLAMIEWRHRDAITGSSSSFA